MSLPSLFISHGAPDLPLRTGRTQDFLRQLLQTLPTPKAILTVSAHWLTAQPTVSLAEQPETLYDFSGFSPQLLELVYPAPGDPALAEQVANRLTHAGFATHTDPRRGYDHGVWTPLMLIAPTATIPVAQLSVQPRQTPEYHFQIGKALAPLRNEGVLILGTGAATHNLRAFENRYDATPPDWVVAFDDWLANAITQDSPQLLNYRQIAPYAEKNHPSEEHLLPLFVVAGAGKIGRQIHHGFTHGALSMAAYRFD